jgi:hypothetical protein
MATLPTSALSTCARHYLLEAIAGQHPEVLAAAVEPAIRKMIADGWPEMPGSQGMAAAIEPLLRDLSKVAGVDFAGCAYVWRTVQDQGAG